jgi:hypothetical protein
VGYRPGDRLDEFFERSQPTPGQNSSDWWGTGHEQQRHQEYSAWATGGHALSMKRLLVGYDGRYGTVTGACLRCHSGDSVLGAREQAGFGGADDGIGCAVCHPVHGALGELRTQCSACHEGGAYYHRPELNATHVACGATSGVGCVGCHMPRVVRIGGTYALHSHRPGIVRPQDGATYDMPNSCMNGGCHADRDLAWAQAAFARHYGDGARAELAGALP